MATVSDVLHHAQRLIQEGQPDKAITLTGKILDQFPDQTDAMLLRAQAHSALGNALAGLFEVITAVGMQPQEARNAHALAVRLKEHNKIHPARRAALLSVALAPDAPWFTAYAQMTLSREPERALRHIFKGFGLAPNDRMLLWRLKAMPFRGTKKQLDYAARLALALDPGKPDALLTAFALMPAWGQKIWDRHQAVLKAIPLNLIDASVLALHGSKHLFALSILLEAVQRLPSEPMAWIYLARTVAGLQRHDVAEDAIRCALALAPGMPTAWRGAGRLAHAIGDAERAVRIFAAARMRSNDHPIDVSAELTTLAYIEDLTDEGLFAAYEGWESRTARQFYPAEPVRAANPDPDRPLKIGMLSADLFAHPIGVNLLGYFEQHDRQAYPLHVYSLSDHDDGIRATLRNNTDQWRDCSALSDKAIADQIREDGIDFLVHTAGHTVQNRAIISAFKPAPLIAAYGDFTTMGLRTVDYILTDSVIHPDNSTERLFEKPMRLPMMVIHAPLVGSPDVGPLPADALGHITFASFNNPAKLSKACLEAWADILAAVPKARLLLQYKRMFADPAVQSRLFDALDKAGVARDRLDIVAGDLSRYDHLNLANRADICLDTFPFSGCTSTFEALWMGLPLVTFAGTRWVQRMTASFLVPLGLGDLVTGSPNAYRETAVALANDLDRLRDLRTGLRDKVAASPLLDHVAYARSVEAGMRAAWRRHCAGQPPAPITIAP